MPIYREKYKVRRNEHTFLAGYTNNMVILRFHFSQINLHGHLVRPSEKERRASPPSGEGGEETNEDY